MAVFTFTSAFNEGRLPCQLLIYNETIDNAWDSIKSHMVDNADLKGNVPAFAAEIAFTVNAAYVGSI